MSDSRPPRRLRTTGRMFAVVDDASEAPGIIEELRRMGVPPNDVAVLRGADGASRIDAAGGAEGIRGRLRRRCPSYWSTRCLTSSCTRRPS